MTVPKTQDILDALDSASFTTIRDFLDRGLDPNWKDEDDKTLLHFAAAAGDEACISRLLEKGAKALSLSAQDQTPQDTAIVYGYTDVARLLWVAALKEKAQLQKEPLPFASLAEIRAKSGAEGVPYFYRLAAEGRISQVADLALKNGESFAAADLTACGRNGESVLMRLGRDLELKKILLPPLWEKTPDVIEGLLDGLPTDVQQRAAAGDFRRKLRQSQLQGKGRDKNAFRLD